MKTIKYFFASAAAALAGLVVHQNVANYPAPGQLPDPAPSSIPAPAPPVIPFNRLALGPISNATDAQANLIGQASLKITETINSDCFGQFMMARGLILDKSANGTDGLSNTEVLQIIQSATGAIPVTVYHQPWIKPSSVMGYRNVGESLIHLRDTSLDSVCDTASLIGHEAIGHVLGGWDHDYNPSYQRQFSVPYSINAGFTMCCKESRT